MEAVKTRETRLQILRRGAAGDDIAVDIAALDAAEAESKRSAKLQSDIAGVQQVIAREKVQNQLQRDHDAAVVSYNEARANTEIAAAKADELIQQAQAAVAKWKESMQVVSERYTVVGHYKQQGATPPLMPTNGLNPADYSLHLLHRAGEGAWQRIMYDGKLPRTS